MKPDPKIYKSNISKACSNFFKEKVMLKLYISNERTKNFFRSDIVGKRSYKGEMNVEIMVKQFTDL